MHSELIEAVQRCSTCQEAALPKEPLMTHPLPKLPWQVVSSDCFEVDGQHYCVYVDNYSDYIEVCALEDLSAKTLISKTKQVFAIHGTPMTPHE